MSNVILLTENNLFGESLKACLETELENSNLVVVNSFLDIEIEKQSVNLLICDLSDSRNIDDILIFQQANPSANILVIHKYITIDEYKKLINSGVKGSILNSAHLNELIHAVKEIVSGKTAFPQQVLQEIMLPKAVCTSKNISILSDREIEILQMLCDGLSNEQISEKLHLSYDTVKWHRSNILIKCESKNILALYKFALKHKLVQPAKI